MLTEKEVVELVEHFLGLYPEDNPYVYSPDVVAVKGAISSLLEVLELEDMEAYYDKYREEE